MEKKEERVIGMSTSFLKKALIKNQEEYFCTECGKYVEVKGFRTRNFCTENITYNGEVMPIKNLELATCVNCGNNEAIDINEDYYSHISLKESNEEMRLALRETTVMIYVDQNKIKPEKMIHLGNFMYKMPILDRIVLDENGQKMDDIKPHIFLEYMTKEKNEVSCKVGYIDGRMMGYIKDKANDTVSFIKNGQKRTVHGLSFSPQNPYRHLENMPKEIQEKMI